MIQYVNLKIKKRFGFTFIISFLLLTNCSDNKPITEIKEESQGKRKYFYENKEKLEEGIPYKSIINFDTTYYFYGEDNVRICVINQKGKYLTQLNFKEKDFGISSFYPHNK
ncbi:MAG: hypothetical protein PF481_11130, partial [Bacteroidales bacterium]|nr:hypothetical protein [Bacteroidales bacterium]